MKVKVRIKTYIDTEATMLCVLDFLEPNEPYFIRCSRLESKFEWELRFYDENCLDVTAIDDTIGELIYANEDELFQRSCVEKFDVYMVQTGMQELHRIMFGRCSTPITSIILEY